MAGKRRSILLRAAAVLVLAGALLAGLGWVGIAMLNRLPPLPEDVREPPEALMTRYRVEAVARAHSEFVVDPWPEAMPPNDYEAFIRRQFEAHPEQRASASAFLEFVRLYHEQYEKREGFWNIDPEWRPLKPLPAEANTWLKEHQTILRAAIRMSSEPPLPTPRTEDLLAWGAQGFWWGSGMSSAGYDGMASHLLVAESQRLQTSGEHEAAAETLQASYRLAGRSGEGSPAWPDKELTDWLSSGAVTSATASQLASALDAVHVSARSPDPGNMIYWIGRRRWAGQLADLPVNEIASKLMSGDRPYVWADRSERSTIRRVLDAATVPIRGLGLAVRFKANAPEYLREYDAWIQFLNWKDTQSYRDQTKADSKLQIAKIFSSGNFMRPRPSEGPYLLPFYNETRLNLERTALHLIQGDAPPLEIGTGSPGWEDSPWRDPFTEEPLKIVSLPDGSTLIYSLGPDLKDQQGRVRWDDDQANLGEFGEGDIVLRLPPRTARAARAGNN